MRKSRTVHTILESLAGAAYMAAAIVLRPLVLPRRRRGGATADELRRALPGDDLVPQSRAGYTQTITVGLLRNRQGQYLTVRYP